MKKTKANSKRYKMTKKAWIIIVLGIFIVGLIVSAFIYINSEKYEKKKLQKTLTDWAEEYYEEKLVSVASGYIKSKAQDGESITINLDALKKFGKNTEIIKNSKNNKQCDDIDTYVSIKVDKNAQDISKDYEVERVILDCFN